MQDSTIIHLPLEETLPSIYEEIGIGSLTDQPVGKCGVQVTDAAAQAGYSDAYL